MREFVGRFFGGTSTLRETVETRARKAAAADDVTATAARAVATVELRVVSG
jgi:hypothetical protein